MMPADIRRRRLRLRGVVQGVGFRPFVYQLATGLELSGLVGNDSDGVFVEIEGRPRQLDLFSAGLVDDQPPMARIDAVEAVDIPVLSEPGFDIVATDHQGTGRTLIPPDVATCEACMRDVADPSDRRFRYPFTNCTDCGPRFTIIHDLPYDRPATTMARFAMCDHCVAEYADPSNRRYHAEPIACPECGPRISFERSAGGAEPVVGTDAALAAVQRSLVDGEIVAIKGLGGYHLACDATNVEAVARLRRRKGRADKPFAIMVPDADRAALIADIDRTEFEALGGRERPIVLLRRRRDAQTEAGVCDAVAPANPLLGVMLPYTPLHHLVFSAVPGELVTPPSAIVLTSGNRSNEPICFDDDEARERLADLADAFCVHDRPIAVPCDDSVVRVIGGEVRPVRRSRGFAPIPVNLPVAVDAVVAAGGELKNTCCVAADRHAWVGQHIGDVENLETLAAFRTSVDTFCRSFGVDPVAYAADEHPGYVTRRWAVDAAAGRDDVSVIDVQHHHAHVASVMVEHRVGVDEEVLGFAFDGTGFGRSADGSTQIWGGEVLLATYASFERAAHLRALPLPGGDSVVRAPCRLAVAWLSALDIPLDPEIPAVAACDDIERGVLARQVARDIGCVPTTSMGRLFDVVSSVLGVRHRIDYEAQAAIELEAVAATGQPGAVTLAFDLVEQSGGPLIIDSEPVLAGIVAAVRSGSRTADVALAFHVAVADTIVRLSDRLAGGRRVALTGGVFQNALLDALAWGRLTDHEVLRHHLVPPNDGGLALGQAIVAGVRLNNDKNPIDINGRA